MKKFYFKRKQKHISECDVCTSDTCCSDTIPGQIPGMGPYIINGGPDRWDAGFGKMNTQTRPNLQNKTRKYKVKSKNGRK